MHGFFATIHIVSLSMLTFVRLDIPPPNSKRPITLCFHCDEMVLQKFSGTSLYIHKARESDNTFRPV
jgi:hypothetical protein